MFIKQNANVTLKDSGCTVTGRTDILIHVFSESRIPLFYRAVRHLAESGSRAWRTSRNVGGGRGRRRTSQDMEDGDATGLGKVRWKVQVVGR